MTTTDDLVETFLKCPTKCFLRSRGEAGTGNDYAAWIRTKNEVFRIEGTKRLVAEVAPDKCAIGPRAMGSLKPAEWYLRIELAVHSQQLQCFCHAVEQIPSAGRGRTAQFVPIRFLFRNKLNRDDKLLLAFDARVLSEELSREVGLGKIVHGENYSTQKVNTSALASDVRRLTDKIGTLLASPSPPDLILNRHCVECEFQNRCRQKAIEKDDLSLLSGMAEKERTDFNSKGIFTVTQLSHIFRPRRRPQGLRDKRERYHHSLKALAIREKKIHIVGNPEVKIEGTAVYMDVEGLPDRDFYYLIGIRIKAGDSVVEHSFWADGPSDEGSIWRELWSKLTEVENPVLIHYGSFETVFLKRMRQRYGAPPNGSLAAKALESLVVVSRHAPVAPSKPEVKNALWTVGVVSKERVTETAKCVVTGLLEPHRCQSGVQMAAKNVGLVQLLTAAGAEQKSRFAVADELNQQLRHVVRKVDFTLPVFRLEVIVDFAVPRLLINNDAGTAVENLLDADTQRLTNSETTRTTEDEKHTHLWLDG